MIPAKQGQAVGNPLAAACRAGRAAPWSSSAPRLAAPTRSGSMRQRARQRAARRSGLWQRARGQARTMLHAAGLEVPRAGKPPVAARSAAACGLRGTGVRRWLKLPAEVAERRSPCCESFITAAGPGGQNVNKVATAVQLRLDVYALRLAPLVFARLKTLAGSKMTARGELVLTARGSAPRKPTAPTPARGCRTARRSAKAPRHPREEPAQPGRQGPATRRQEKARNSEGRARQSELRLKRCRWFETLPLFPSSAPLRHKRIGFSVTCPSQANRRPGHPRLRWSRPHWHWSGAAASAPPLLRPIRPRSDRRPSGSS